MASHSSITSSTSTSDSSLQPTPEMSLDQRIEGALQGRYQSEAAKEFVESCLKDNALDSLLIATAEVCSLLQNKGYGVMLTYCTSKYFGHPVPVLTVRDDEGRCVVPNINSYWDPVIPLERGRDVSNKETLTGDEDFDAEAAGFYSPQKLVVETFSANAPVRILLLSSDSENTSVQAVPFFSENALNEAREHAARRVMVDDFYDYSFVFDEVISPAVGARIREDSALFGRRDTPRLTDAGTSPDGSFFDFIAAVPMHDGTEELALRGAVIQNEVSLTMNLIEDRVR